MSQSNRIRGETNDLVFQELGFLLEKGASVVADFDLFNFWDAFAAGKENQLKKIGLLYLK